MPPRFDTELDYAWKWFSYHAGQRLTAFNFFLVAISLVSVGYAQAVVSDLQALGVGLGFVGVVVSLAFWAMDVRNAELVEYGRDALKHLETQLSPPVRLRTRDEARDDLAEVLGRGLVKQHYLWWAGRNAERANRFYTHTNWLRRVLILFGAMALLGLVWAATNFAGVAHAHHHASGGAHNFRFP